MMRYVLSAVCVASVLSFVRADNAVAAKDDPKAIAEKCSAYMDARMKISKFSGSLLVARNGEILFEHGYGLANVINTTKTHLTLAPGAALSAELTVALFAAKGGVKRVGLDGVVELEG